MAIPQPKAMDIRRQKEHDGGMPAAAMPARGEKARRRSMKEEPGGSRRRRGMMESKSMMMKEESRQALRSMIRQQVAEQEEKAAGSAIVRSQEQAERRRLLEERRMLLEQKEKESRQAAAVRLSARRMKRQAEEESIIMLEPLALLSSWTVPEDARDSFSSPFGMVALQAAASFRCDPAEVRSRLEDAAAEWLESLPPVERLAIANDGRRIIGWSRKVARRIAERLPTGRGSMPKAMPKAERLEAAASIILLSSPGAEEWSGWQKAEEERKSLRRSKAASLRLAAWRKDQAEGSGEELPTAALRLLSGVEAEAAAARMKVARAEGTGAWMEDDGGMLEEHGMPHPVADRAPGVPEHHASFFLEPPLLEAWKAAGVPERSLSAARMILESGARMPGEDQKDHPSALLWLPQRIRKDRSAQWHCDWSRLADQEEKESGRRRSRQALQKALRKAAGAARIIRQEKEKAAGVPLLRAAILSRMEKAERLERMAEKEPSASRRRGIIRQAERSRNASRMLSGAARSLLESVQDGERMLEQEWSLESRQAPPPLRHSCQPQCRHALLAGMPSFRGGLARGHAEKEQAEQERKDQDASQESRLLSSWSGEPAVILWRSALLQEQAEQAEQAASAARLSSHPEPESIRMMERHAERMEEKAERSRLALL